MAKQVVIDTEECIGCQNCVEICPEVFGFNDDEDKAFVINPDGGDIKCAEQAAESCPAECFILNESADQTLKLTASPKAQFSSLCSSATYLQHYAFYQIN